MWRSAMAERVRVAGTPIRRAAPELVRSGFQIESDDAAHLHDGLNLADIAHVLDLSRRGIIPADAERALLALLLDLVETDATDFRYDPELGEPYNSREHYFAERLGDMAGWLHAGRPRREAARVALRLGIRRQVAELADAVVRFAGELCGRAREHADTLMADQTYLQQAQPSTFGHYLLSFAQPALRDAERLLGELRNINASPGGAGCVNGTRLQDDRSHLAEDLEIFSSAEFDFVDLDDSFSRSSVLMPQKRNPYSLSIVRGASGVLIGRMSGFLAVTKSPSARSDNFIFAYGEVPRALDLSLRVTELMSGVVRTLEVHPDRMRAELDRGYAQATDLAEYLTVSRHIDYRTAYVVVGNVVRDASRAGIPGRAITAATVEEAAFAQTRTHWGVTDDEIAHVLSASSVVATRTATGGAAPEAFAEAV